MLICGIIFDVNVDEYDGVEKEIEDIFVNSLSQKRVSNV